MRFPPEAKSDEEILKISLLPNEKWWGGAVSKGSQMPFSGETGPIVLRGSTHYNQAAPVLLSNKGRIFWSEKPFDFEIKNEHLLVQGNGKMHLETSGHTLHSAHRKWTGKFFPLPGEIPPEILFAQPQYCTWMILGPFQEQNGILAYARELIRRGYPPGVFIIDDTWQDDYGTWEFHPGRFPDPSAMIKELQELGFVVMLWVIPYVSPDSSTARALHKQNLLLRDRDDSMAIVRWWNGASAALDLTHPKAVQWFQEKLDGLMLQYGVAGFKFDGGDASHYDPSWKMSSPASPNELTEHYNHLGLRYKLNEFRAGWKCNGFPLNQRLCDKDHSWEGLKCLLTDSIAANLIGYPFGAPDMVAGGQYNHIEQGSPFDAELFVRSTQASALMAMIQFSLPPWKLLSAEQEGIILQMLEKRRSLSDYIVKAARYSAQTGNPLIRSMEYSFPEENWSAFRFQYLLGENLLIAPVVEKGAIRKEVKLPLGKWISDQGEAFQGPGVFTVEAPLWRLPFFQGIRSEKELPLPV